MLIQNYQLFYDQTHLVNSLLEEIGKRIIHSLGFDENEVIHLNQQFVSEEIPVLPSIKRALGME